MIRVTQQDSASAAKQYYATADYYIKGQEQELIGSWGGKGARQLGLHGQVDKASFEQLCDNLDPRTGTPLTVRTRSERRVGYDFTFSVPKSVSLLYALHGDQKILAAFRESVAETMQEIEGEMKTRVRKDGKDEDRTTGNIVWAEFIHTTSRPVDAVPDPQLHAHCFAFNSTWDPEERRWKAGQFGEVKRDSPYFQAAFRVRLANRLQDIGYGVTRKKDDFEIAGIAADVLKRFSRRTTLIEKVAAERGITDPERKSELGAETREKKNKEMSWAELQEAWNSRMSVEERHILESVHNHATPFERSEPGEVRAVDYAIDHSFVREAVVSERKLVTVALQRGLGAVTVQGVTQEMRERPLIRKEVEGRQHATTQEMISLETQIIDFARNGRGRRRPLGDPNRPITREKFNEGQKAAVRLVLGSRDVVTIIRGAAGTGKTTLEDELRLAFAEAKVPVAALAQSTGAVDELRKESGFAGAATIARFLKDTKMQESIKGGVVLVDEASLVGTRDMHRLFDIVQDAGARIVLVGDNKRQHRSVSAGEPMKLLEEQAGVRVAEVTEIVRQTNGDYLKAAKALRDGKIAQAFGELNKLGWITEIPHAGRYWVLSLAYLSATLEKDKEGKPKTALVVSPTHAECDRITRFVRNAMKEDGRLGEERIFSTWVPTRLTDAQKADATHYEPGDLLEYFQNASGGITKGTRQFVTEGAALPLNHANRFEVYRPRQLSVAVGDRLRLTTTGATKDGRHKLANGVLLTVQGFTKRGDLIVGHGWVIDRDFGHIDYGVAVTSHAAQGKTVHKVFIGLSSDSFPATNQRSFYVPVTRGKEQAAIFTDDKKELLRIVQRPDDPMSATELAPATPPKPGLRNRLSRQLGFGTMMPPQGGVQQSIQRDTAAQREADHAR